MAARVFNEQGVRPAELVVKDAKELADEVGGSDEATRSQVRKFYQEYVSIRQSVPRHDADAYARNEVALKMLIAKTEYAAARKDSKLPAQLKQWLQKNIRAISGPADIHDFGDYFEAFVGYFYGASQNSGGGRPQQRQGQGYGGGGRR